MPWYCPAPMSASVHSGVATIVPIGDDSGRLTLYLSDENIGSLSFDERTRSEIAIGTLLGSSIQATCRKPSGGKGYPPS